MWATGRAGHVERYQLQSYRFKPFFVTLKKLSLFTFEIVAFCNGLQCNDGSPLSVTNSGTHKNLMDQQN
jgi:hypothetical protein